MKLTVVIAMIADAMAFIRNASHEMWPALRMAAENEERRPYSALAERIENGWRGFRVRSVIERQCELGLACSNL